MARRPPVDERQRIGIQRDPNGMPYVFDDLNRVVQRDASGNLTNMTVDGEPIIGSPSTTRRSAQDVQRARKRLEDQQRHQNRQQERQQERSSAPPSPQATSRPPANPTNVARGDGSQSITPIPADATPALAPADPVDRTQLGPVAQQPIGVFDPASNVVVSPMAPDYISPMGRTQWTDVRANGRVIPATPTGQQALNALIPGYANMQPEQRAAALRSLRADTGLGTGQVTGQVGTVTGRTSLAPDPGRSFATAFNPGGATEIRNPLVPGGPQAYGTVNHASVRDARTGVSVEVPTRSLVAGARVNPAFLGNQDNAPASTPAAPAPAAPAAPPTPAEPTKPPAYVPPPSVARGSEPTSPSQSPVTSQQSEATASPLQRSLGREIGETVRDTGRDLGRYAASAITNNPLARAAGAYTNFVADIAGGITGTGTPLAPPQLAERRTEPTPSPIVPSNPDLAQRRAADLSFPPATSTGGPIHQPLASSGSAFDPPSTSPGRAIAEAASNAGAASVGGPLAEPRAAVRKRRNNE